MAFGKEGFGFGSSGGGGSAADVIYKGNSPTTITVGGLPAGSAIYGLSLQQIDQDILCPFIIPTFASYYSNISNPLEVGTTLSGNHNFYWSFNTVQDVLDNTINIIDATSSTTLASNQSIAGGLGTSINIGSIANTVPAVRTYKAIALDLNSNPLQPAYFQIYWYWREWYGNNNLATLTAAQIQNPTYLQNSYLSSSFPASYYFGAGGYKWFVWDDQLGSPTAVTGFKDAATGLQISMADSSDNAFFSNHVGDNGWAYGIVSVTQNGVTSNKRCYRTKNILGGSLQALVS